MGQLSSRNSSTQRRVLADQSPITVQEDSHPVCPPITLASLLQTLSLLLGLGEKAILRILRDDELAFTIGDRRTVVLLAAGRRIHKRLAYSLPIMWIMRIRMTSSGLHKLIMLSVLAVT